MAELTPSPSREDPVTFSVLETRPTYQHSSAAGIDALRLSLTEPRRRVRQGVDVRDRYEDDLVEMSNAVSERSQTQQTGGADLAKASSVSVRA